MRSAVANDSTSPAASGNRPEGTGVSPVACAAMRTHISPRIVSTMPRSSPALRPNASGPSAQARNASISCCRALAGQQTVRLELQPPVIERRELSHRGLSRDDLRARRRVQQPCRERRASTNGRRRPEPLEERGAAEEIQVERVGVIGQVDAGRSVRVRQAVPVARAARQGPHVDEPQRVVPRHALVHTGMPRDEDPEHDEEQERDDERQRRGAARQRPHEHGRRDEECRQPQPRDRFRELRLLLAIRWRGARRSRRTEPDGLEVSRHAACSMPAGLVAAMFSRQ